VGPLCDFVKRYAVYFDDSNVAVSFRKLLEAPWTVPSTAAEKILWQQTVALLEDSAKNVMEHFQPRHIAAVLHITAKYGYETCLLPELERWAEVVAGEFNSQNISNTMWAYVIMGRKPGDRLMGLLEQRAETISGEFNSQEIANTLWSYAKMGRKLGDRLIGLLERRAATISGEFNSTQVQGMKRAYEEMNMKPGDHMSRVIERDTLKRKRSEGER
jgi:hypothetical protein